MRSNKLGVIAVVALACGCGGGENDIGDSLSHRDMPAANHDMVAGDLAGHDMSFVGSDLFGADLATEAADNVVPVVVDHGPPGGMVGVYNIPYISVTICAPGSASNCTTVDHIEVDTGSTGLRIISSAISASVLKALPNETVAGNNLTECYILGGEFVYGSVRTADVRIGGEKAAASPVMLMGDPAYSGNIPTDCSSTGADGDTADVFQANGLIGITVLNPDCGDACTRASGQTNPLYYSCIGSACTAVGVPVAGQLPNIVASFASDNNGSMLELPAISDSGAGPTMGTLIFGIGTQTNNALGSANVYQTDSSLGTITTIYNDHSFTYSYFDSGTQDLSFPNGSIAACTGDLSGFDCPNGSTPEILTATIKSVTGATGTADFKVANSNTTLELDTTSNCAFDDIADVGSGDSNAFAWGLPFFYGRKVFFAIGGAATPKGTGPYYAF